MNLRLLRKCYEVDAQWFYITHILCEHTTVFIINTNINIPILITCIHHECRNMMCTTDEVVLPVYLEGVHVLSSYLLQASKYLNANFIEIGAVV